MLESRLESTGCRRRRHILPDGICAAVPSSSPDWSVGFFFFSTFLYTACVVVFARAHVRVCLYAYRSRPKRRGESVVFYPARPSVCARARVTTPSSGGVECRCRLAVWRLRLCRSFSRRYLVRLVVVVHTPLILDRRRTSLLTVKTLDFLFTCITLGFDADRPTRKTNIFTIC